MDRTVKQPRLGDGDAMGRKRQILVDYALRNKMGAIIDIVNLRTPFDIVKELVISKSLYKQQTLLLKKCSIQIAFPIWKN